MVNADGEISCEACPAACCKAGSNLTLTVVEHQRHRRAMKLSTVAKPRDYPQVVEGRAFVLGEDGQHHLQAAPPVVVPRHRGFYVLLEDCGNLEEPEEGRVSRHCTVYDNRPEACRAYQVGSEACLAARAAAGLDGHAPVPDQIRLDPDAMRTWFADQP